MSRHFIPPLGAMHTLAPKSKFKAKNCKWWKLEAHKVSAERVRAKAGHPQGKAIWLLTGYHQFH